MNTSRTSSRWAGLAIAAMMIVGAGAAFAAELPAAQMPSKEMRNKMAATHEKMAACLRSETPFADCRSEMQQNCKTMMGEEGCPMKRR
jgi:hypothetical protein